MDPSSRTRLRNLGIVFRINPEFYADNPEVALKAFIMLYSLPLIANEGQRKDYGQKILDTIRPHFDGMSTFA